MSGFHPHPDRKTYALALLVLGLSLPCARGAEWSETEAAIDPACFDMPLKSHMGPVYFNKVTDDSGRASVSLFARGEVLHRWHVSLDDGAHPLIRTEATHAALDYVPVPDSSVQQNGIQMSPLEEQPGARTTLQGLIMSVDEASNGITVQLDSGSQTQLDVQDGLIFDAVHRGEYVEITVENIGGVKTLVRLKKL